jgi:uncharacterized protein YidB (DUF937 family)
MDRRTRIIAASIAALAITSAAGSGIAMAITDDDRTAAPAPTQQQAGTGHPVAERFLDRLALELGVERGTLDAAIRSTARGLLDEEAAEGDIPPAVEDALRRAIDGFPDISSGAGILKEVLRDALPRDTGPAEGMTDPGAVIARLANSLRSGSADLAAFLGINEADLRSALAGGQSLLDLAEANRVSRDELQQYLEAEARLRIREVSANGGLPPVIAALVEAQVPQLVERLLAAGRP